MGSDFNLGWLVALLEGEGCFGCYPHKTGLNLKVAVRMTDRDVVERAAAQMGAATTRGPYDTGPNKPNYVAEVGGYKAVRLMEMALPHMGQRRALQIRSALKTWHSRPHRREKGLPPECRPDRPHWARGLCQQCGSASYYRARLALK